MAEDLVNVFTTRLIHEYDAYRAEMPPEGWPDTLIAWSDGRPPVVAAITPESNRPGHVGYWSWYGRQARRALAAEYLYDAGLDEVLMAYADVAIVVDDSGPREVPALTIRYGKRGFYGCRVAEILVVEDGPMVDPDYGLDVQWLVDNSGPLAEIVQRAVNDHAVPDRPGFDIAEACEAQGIATKVLSGSIGGGEGTC